MPDTLQLLSFQTADAATNMAIDAAMRVAAERGGGAFLRFYGWTEAAATFGYSQRWETVRAMMGPDLTLVRRETGGGIVDHRHDLTYALAFAERSNGSTWSASKLYCQVHEALATALCEVAVEAALAPCRTLKSASGLASACFQRAEPSDVIDPGSGRKLAGAAMRRHRRTLLLQGSIDRGVFSSSEQESEFSDKFAKHLAHALDYGEVSPLPRGLRELAFDSLLAQFRSKAWNRKR